jgi:hypothetical protein
MLKGCGKPNLVLKIDPIFGCISTLIQNYSTKEQRRFEIHHAKFKSSPCFFTNDTEGNKSMLDFEHESTSQQA